MNAPTPLQVTPVRAFNDNYIWLIHSLRNPHRVYAVDPGDAGPVLRVLQTTSLELAGVLITHHHGDHVGGLPALLNERQVPVYGPAREQIERLTVRLTEGDRVELTHDGLSFEVLDVPGHTAGHIAYVGHAALFCGDTLFSAGCGRLFEGTAEQMQRSLAKFAGLHPDTRVYCAHEYTVSNLKFARAVEPLNADVNEWLTTCERLRENDEMTLPSTIRRELKVNPFLRCGVDSVKQAAEQQAGRELRSDTETFAVVRKWKDGFRS